VIEATNELLVALTNDALREATNAAGDNAYYLRQTVTVALNAPPAVTTMPAAVKRLYKLERQGCPGSYIEWDHIRHDDSGNMVILAECGETVTAHYHEALTEITTDMSESQFPWMHEELIVVMVMQKLAETNGSDQKAALLMELKEELLGIFVRDCMFYERQRFDTMSTMYSRESWASQLEREWNT
jgi:hypothetical protein